MSLSSRAVQLTGGGTLSTSDSHWFDKFSLDQVCVPYQNFRTGFYLTSCLSVPTGPSEPIAFVDGNTVLERDRLLSVDCNAILET